VSIYSRGEKKSSGCPSASKTCVSAMERFGAVGFSGLVDAGPRIDPVFSCDRQAQPLPANANEISAIRSCGARLE
jgi:hypothetical protein